MKRNQNVAVISDFELRLVHEVSRATFPVASPPKRFIRDISAQTKLSDRGRCYLAYIANRFRRQYSLSPDQWAWVNEWLAKDHTLEVEPGHNEASKVIAEHSQPSPSATPTRDLEAGTISEQLELIP